MNNEPVQLILKQPNEFSNVLEPINILVNVVYKTDLEIEMVKVSNKYTGDEYIKYCDSLLSDASLKVINMIAKKHRNEIAKFFNDDGLIAYIQYLFGELLTEFVNTIREEGSTWR
jgi:hypothetical protein